jgi:DNA modification methylase
VGQLVVDMFGGTLKTALAAKRLARLWTMTENILDYIAPSAELFRQFPWFEINPGFEMVRGAG